MSGPSPAVAATRLAVRGPVRRAAAQGTTILVACSGGPDSLALAAAVAFEAKVSGRRGRPVHAGAVVVDHALQPGSGQVAEQAAHTCRELGLAPVILRAVDSTDAAQGAAVDSGPSRARTKQKLAGRTQSTRGAGGPEAAARRARYAVFEAVAGEMPGPVHVWLAHTRDDQAEQVLLGLARGSGTRSLAGMPPRRGMIHRPLLGVSAQDTRTACLEQGLQPWFDPHNRQDRFARVRARGVLTLLEEALGPGTTEALARSADLARADADLLDDLAEERLLTVRDVAQGLGLDAQRGPWPVAALQEVEPALRARVLRRLTRPGATARDPLARVHLQGLLDLVERWRGQGPVDLPGAPPWHRWRTEAGVPVVGPLVAPRIGNNETSAPDPLWSDTDQTDLTEL